MFYAIYFKRHGIFFLFLWHTVLSVEAASIDIFKKRSFAQIDIFKLENDIWFIINVWLCQINQNSSKSQHITVKLKIKMAIK